MDEQIEIMNAEITNVYWSREPVLTHWIMVSGDSWGCGFGGYALKGEVAFDWIEQVCDTLECDFNEKEMIGKVVRVKSTGWGGTVVAIGHPIKDKWFEPAEFFKKYKTD